MTFVVCVVVCSVVYAGMRYSLLREVDLFLKAEIHELAGRVLETPDDLAGAEQAIRLELGKRPQADLLFRLFSREGRLLLTSDAGERDATPWRFAESLAAPAEEPVFGTSFVEPRGASFRVCSERVDVSGVTTLAQVSYSLANMDRSLASVRMTSLAALALASVLAFLAARFLARRSLAPVDAMSATARRIGTEAFWARIPRSGAEDELDRLAETLNLMLDRIQEHVEAMARFTADASHELRSPLAALRGMAEVALTRPRSAEELREVLEASLDEYARLHHLAEGLLLLARGDAAAGSVGHDSVSIAAVVEDIVELYSPLAEESGVILSAAPVSGARVRGDGSRLRQLLGNLIDNAIKYGASPGRVEVRVEEADDRVRITVADDGPGIPEADLPRVFDRFYRSDRSRSSRGAGLGLAICEWIARAHGGGVTLTSAAGAGTTATVELPRAAG